MVRTGKINKIYMYITYRMTRVDSDASFHIGIRCVEYMSSDEISFLAFLSVLALT